MDFGYAVLRGLDALKTYGRIQMTRKLRLRCLGNGRGTRVLGAMARRWS